MPAPLGRRDAALSARAGANGVPARRTRQRLRAGWAVIALGAALCLVGLEALRRAHLLPGDALFFLGDGLVGIVLQGLLWSTVEGRTVVHGPGGRLATARTLIGLRTLRLDLPARVRRVRLWGRPRVWDGLWVTDRRGVTLLLDDARAVARIGAAVRAAQQAGEPVRVSRSAAVRLGLEPPPGRVRRTVRGVVDFSLQIAVPLGTVGLCGLFSWVLTFG
ncbi:hypothetical protein Kpho02_07820 [Kitasatospora phosalacinea]|uniref:PH domain-containing protein n=1 Tax=Kitasatospora phosalacinea TaxID=2065 RepID=A0A9W6Q4W1_9ACTN|nr:hypothetical protein Kpho02_07820 [Kitasatospora phosalacinea]